MNTNTAKRLGLVSLAAAVPAVVAYLLGHPALPYGLTGAVVAALNALESVLTKESSSV